MKTTIDAAGRVVLPVALRNRLGLRGGQTVEIRERDGRIEIEPASTEMALEDRGEGVVAVPEGDLPALDDETVRETIERVRRRSPSTRASSSPPSRRGTKDTRRPRARCSDGRASWPTSRWRASPS